MSPGNLSGTSTYRIIVINIIDPSSPESSFHNRNILNGDSVAEALTFTIDNAWGKDVASDTRFFTFVDDRQICSGGLFHMLFG